MDEAARVVDQVLAHLCGKGLYGDVTEWCEARHDCVFVVTCPDCRHTFTLTEEEFALLVRRSQELKVCGIALGAVRTAPVWPLDSFLSCNQAR
jgi:hypothetical protein